MPDSGGSREAERIWRAALGEAAPARRLATRFRVSAAEAAAACRYAEQIGALESTVGPASRARLTPRTCSRRAAAG